MSKIGKIAKCSKCGQEKSIFYELDVAGGEKKVYCKKCDEWNHEKVKCKKCGQELQQQELADHLLAYHSEI